MLEKCLYPYVFYPVSAETLVERYSHRRFPHHNRWIVFFRYASCVLTEKNHDEKMQRCKEEECVVFSQHLENRKILLSGNQA